MELLGRIVPAIRETRTPLIVGYGWLLAGWLMIGAWTDTDLAIDRDSQPGTPMWLFERAFDVLSEFGLGVAMTVAAFIVGSLTGFIWDQFARPIDERALRDRAARLVSEAQLRLQLSPPIGLGAAALSSFDLRFAAGFIIPVLLVAHGWALWREAKRLPVRADLRDADLSSAHLVGANFAHADLSGANLQGANLTSASMEATTFDERTQLNGAILNKIRLTAIAGGLIARHLRESNSAHGVDLHFSRIFGDLSGTNLSGADLTMANLAEADLTGANLSGADLTAANLTGANLTAANLGRAYLTGANLTGADLTGATLTGTDLTEPRWIEDRPPRWPDGYDPPVSA